MTWLKPFFVGGRPITLKYSNEVLKIFLQPVLFGQPQWADEGLSRLCIEQTYAGKNVEARRLSAVY